MKVTRGEALVLEAFDKLWPKEFPREIKAGERDFAITAEVLRASGRRLSDKTIRRALATYRAHCLDPRFIDAPDEREPDTDAANQKSASLTERVLSLERRVLSLEKYIFGNANKAKRGTS